MSPHKLKLRARKLWRRQTSQVEEISREAGEQFEENFLARLGRLQLVWQFVLLWVLVVSLVGAAVGWQLSLLKQYYQVLEPVPGGIYSEGIKGSFTTANPLYAVNDVDTSVARLIFSGLLTYDSRNRLVGDLADKWSVNKDGTVYTVHLRPHVTWHDGRPFTAADVVFTYQTIQDPDAQSPLFASWQNVKVTAVGASTVTFTLPNPLSSFPSSLTNGIVPKHVLASVDPVDLRSASFNTVSPIGTGPFKWSTIGVSGAGDKTEEQISLAPFGQYWDGEPKLTSFNIFAFANGDDMLKAYNNKELTAMAGLNSVPDSVATDPSAHVYNLPLTAGVYVFFKTTEPLFKDVKVRQALVAAADPAAVIRTLGYSAMPVDEPLLKGQLGYSPKYAQASANSKRAQKLLSADGWLVGHDGIRTKHGQRLTFMLSALDSSEYSLVSRELAEQWRAVGVDVQVMLQPAADFQGNLSSHSYDAALYGISIGADPDVFVYWDSSQASVQSANRLNFSEYSSAAADVALEAGRTRLDPTLRAAKYQALLQAWQRDAPALGLYQPRFLYISHTAIYGLSSGAINTDDDRFRNIEDWMIHRGWVIPSS